MDRIPDMSFFFRRQEKAVLFFEMDPAVADSYSVPSFPGAGATASVLPSAWYALSAAVPV